VPEATHHAGTAKVTSAITATRTKAVPRRVIQLLMVMRDSRLSREVTIRLYPGVATLTAAGLRLFPSFG
jgi:hypothetical protein